MNFSLSFFQNYWWFLVSLLGALLVFLLFVQGGQSLLPALGNTAARRDALLRSLGKKWELTFTTLVTFGGAFFASFPLFYSTSFGGAYWVWMAILFSFVVQAVSYEYIAKRGNLLGRRGFTAFLLFNGVLGPVLLGAAVSTFFHGAEFAVNRENLTAAMPVISTWANPLHGLEAVGNLWNVALGLAVFFLSRALACLYFINNIDDAALRADSRRKLLGSAVAFLAFFLPWLGKLFLKPGWAVDAATGVVAVEDFKYLHNFLALPGVLVLLLVGVVLVLAGIGATVLKPGTTATTDAAATPTASTASTAAATAATASTAALAAPPAAAANPGFIRGIWLAGPGTVFVVLALLLVAGLNNTAYYPSLTDTQSSLALANSSSSLFTLRTMSVVSLFIPFVLGYVWIVWRALDKKKETVV
jgi:cytochrome d ubiquinol oxidase subunit II